MSAVAVPRIAARPAVTRVDHDAQAITGGAYAIEVRAPRDYGTGGKCPCGAPLSRYNGNAWCVSCIATHRAHPSKGGVPART